MRHLGTLISNTRMLRNLKGKIAFSIFSGYLSTQISTVCAISAEVTSNIKLVWEKD